MNTYRIINTTNEIGKREINYNSTLDIEYVDGMTKKIIKLKPSETLYLTLKSLPLSIRKLIVKHMVDVIEIPENQLKAIMSPQKSTVDGLKTELSNSIEAKLHNKKIK